MKKLLLLINLFLLGSLAYSQNVGIGTASPDASAKLDIVSTSGGILIPRVALASASDATTIASPATGLMIWNTGASWGSPGFYFNKGTAGSPSWVLVLDSTSSLDDADADPNNEVQDLSLSGNTLSLSGDASTVDLTPYVNTDDQKIDVFNLSGTTLNLSLESDAEATKTVDFSGLVDHDWYKVGTTTPPTTINDNIYTNGQAAIGMTNPYGNVLSVASTSTGVKIGHPNTYNQAASGVLSFDENIASSGSGTCGFQFRHDGSADALFLENGCTSMNNSMTFLRYGNVGVGTTTPDDKFHVAGNIHADGIAYWGNSGSRTETRNDAGLQGNAGARSGFYETSAPSPAANWPGGASSWWHLLDIRHSNTSNNYAMQIAGSFFDQSLYFRKTNNSASTPWSRLLSSSDISGTTNYVSKFTSANTLGNSQIYDNGTNVGFGNASPSYKIHASGDIYADGGWFRVSGNQGLYFQTWGGGWYMQDATWVRAYNGKSVWTPATMQADVSMFSPVFNFGSWNNGDPTFYDGQMYRTGGQGLVRVDDWFYIRDDDNNNRIRFNTDAGRIECGPGASNGDAISFGGYISSNSTSDGHQILPLTGNWGYVGTSSRYWYYMYSNNFIDQSSKEKKKDFTTLDNSLYDYVMNDIDNLEPTFYRYKAETSELVEGMETKYRPNLHLGVILEDAPDYVQDQAFSGIDIYAMSVLSLAGVKYNRAQIQELKSNQNNKSDFGQSELINNEVFVPFDHTFSATLNSVTPIVNVTPTSPNTGYYVKEVSNNGFILASNTPFTFNWSAMNVASEEIDNSVRNIETKINGLEVSDADKARIKAYWDNENQKQLAEYETYLNNLRISDPEQFEKLIKVNETAQQFLNINNK